MYLTHLIHYFTQMATESSEMEAIFLKANLPIYFKVSHMVNVLQHAVRSFDNPKSVNAMWPVTKYDCSLQRSI